MILRAGVAAVIAVLLSAAAQADDVPAAPQGRIYIRRVESDPVPFPSPLTIDRKRAKGPGHGACFYYDLAPGSHAIHAMSEHDATVDLAAGGTAYVELAASEREIGGGYLDQIEPSVVHGFDTAACGEGEMVP